MSLERIAISQEPPGLRTPEILEELERLSDAVEILEGHVDDLLATLEFVSRASVASMGAPPMESKLKSPLGERLCGLANRIGAMTIRINTTDLAL